MPEDIKPPTAQPPYLMAALICDDILEEKDGRLTILRLTTDVRVEAESARPLEKMPPIPVRVTVVASFNAGGRPGNYEVRLNVIDPDGKERLGPLIPMELRHDHFTVNLITKLQIEARTVGVYWIVVLLEGRQVTRMPLDVQYVWKKLGQTKRDSSEEQNSTHETR